MTAKFAPSIPVDLASPEEHRFSVEELAQFNGVHKEQIFVAVRGYVFDVSSKSAIYGPGGRYHVFAGKDASRGLAKSSTDPSDATSDTSDLTEKELGTLSDWFLFFSQRYNIMGTIDS